MRGLVLPVLLLQISVISTAPLLQWLQRNQMMTLQQQLLELQRMQQFYPMSQFGLNTLTNQPQPIVIILPDDQTNIKTNMALKTGNQNDRIEELKTNTQEEDDSVIVDAEPIPTIDDRKAIIVLPSGRFSIGDFISAIPFLPIEINVPDTISWIGNGISGIISGIGQRFPFQRPSQNTMSNVAVKSKMDLLTNSQNNPNNMKPIIVLPLSVFNRQFFPVQL